MKKKNFESQFLSDELRQLITNVTIDSLPQTKETLILAMVEGKHFKNASPHIENIRNVKSTKGLQTLFWSYLLKAEGCGVIS